MVVVLENQQARVEYAGGEIVLMTFFGFRKGRPYRAAMKEVVRILRETPSAKKILLDSGKASVADPEDHAWARDVWFPSCMAAGLEAIAIISSRNAIADAQLRRRRDEAREAALEAGRPLAAIEFFENVEAAEAWLTASPEQG